MGCDGLWSYLTNFVMRLKLEREKPSSHVSPTLVQGEYSDYAMML